MSKCKSGSYPSTSKMPNRCKRSLEDVEDTMETGEPMVKEVDHSVVTNGGDGGSLNTAPPNTKRQQTSTAGMFSSLF